jgi:hypothetical protein
MPPRRHPYLDVSGQIHVPFKSTPGYRRLSKVFAGPKDPTSAIISLLCQVINLILGFRVTLYISREIAQCAPVPGAHQNAGFGFGDPISQMSGIVFAFRKSGVRFLTTGPEFSD